MPRVGTRVNRVDPAESLAYDRKVTTPRTPMLWPESWTEPSMLDLLRDTPFDCLVAANTDLPVAAAEEARRRNIGTVSLGAPPSGIEVIKGEWPGVRLTESGAVDRVSAGPTGDPWIDSNGWRIRLASALQPESTIWVHAVPGTRRRTAEAYALTVADAAAHGGRWIVSIDSRLASDLISRQPDAIAAWRRVGAAAAFFASRAHWSAFRPAAVMGVVSNFSGKNEFLSQELLNLVARTNQQYRVLPRGNITPQSISGLKTVIYADDEPPRPDLRRTLLDFVAGGGLLVTGKQWPLPPGAEPFAEEHPRYAQYVSGRGRIAVAHSGFDDPYVVAGDAVVLMSHRHELLRFWNGGAVGSCFTLGPGGKSAVVHFLFYADVRFGNTTVRISGRYRECRLWTLLNKEPVTLELSKQTDAVEVHLPPLTGYAALELET